MSNAALVNLVRRLSGTDFELLCGELLSHLGFQHIFHRKAGSQSGRDIEASIDNAGNAERWYFECKNYSGVVPFAEIINKLYLIQHLAPRPDALVLLSSGQLSNDTHDFLESFAEDVEYPILIVAEESPVFAFSQLLVAGGNSVRARLQAVQKRVPPLDGDAVAALKSLFEQKSRRRSPSARIERALRLQAYPRLDITTQGNHAHWATMKLRVTNVGSGFADRVRLSILYHGRMAGQADLPAIASGASVDRNIQTDIRPVSPAVGGDRVILVLDYANALNQRFQVSFAIDATFVTNAWKYSECKQLLGLDADEETESGA